MAIGSAEAAGALGVMSSLEPNDAQASHPDSAATRWSQWMVDGTAGSEPKSPRRSLLPRFAPATPREEAERRRASRADAAAEQRRVGHADLDGAPDDQAQLLPRCTVGPAAKAHEGASVAHTL